MTERSGIGRADENFHEPHHSDGGANRKTYPPAQVRGLTNFFNLKFSMVINLSIPVPSFIERICVWAITLYLKRRFGYTCRLIPLTRGKFAIVDPEDFEKLSQYKWQAYRAGRTFYAKHAKWVNGKTKTVSLHREIMQPSKDLMVDHINHNGLDNRRANLRLASPLQNSWNSRRGYKKYKCVYYNKINKKWYVRFRKDKGIIQTGYFDSEIEAAKAYDEAIKKHRGEFAVLNFKENSIQ